MRCRVSRDGDSIERGPYGFGHRLWFRCHLVNLPWGQLDPFGFHVELLFNEASERFAYLSSGVPIIASRYSQASVRSGVIWALELVWVNDRTANLFYEQLGRAFYSRQSGSFGLRSKREKSKAQGVFFLPWKFYSSDTKASKNLTIFPIPTRSRRRSSKTSKPSLNFERRCQPVL